MFVRLLKRSKSLGLVASLLSVSLFYALYTFIFANYENKDAIIKFLRPRMTQDDYFNVYLHKHLSLIGKSFKKSLEHYEIERRNFGQKFKQAAMENITFHHFINLEVNSLMEALKHTDIVCGDDLFLLIQVHSSPENFINRQAIRLSWGRMDHFIDNLQHGVTGARAWKTVFLIGKSSNEKVNQLVTQEAAIHKDIVIGTFEDSFRNLYMKIILSINWPLEQNCSASYILKTDEDCFVNIGNLFHWLNSYHMVNSTHPIYAGRVQNGMPVVRDKDNRYYLSEKEFSEPYFDPYCSGGGYVFSGDLLQPLLSEVSKESPLFPNEDALLGSFMRRIGVNPTDNTKFLPSVYCAHPDKNREANMCSLTKQIVVHGVKGKQQLQMHFKSALLNSLPSFCSALQDSNNFEEIRDQCQYDE